MKDFFSADKPVVNAFAPGRMDVMGGIADYSGSLLLQMPVQQTTRVQLQFRDDNLIKIRSVTNASAWDDFSTDISAFRGMDYAEASAAIHALPGGDWAAYVLGCVMVLHVERRVPLQGLSILIESKVPVGKGVSSSAALEVAVMSALCKAAGIRLGETELPLLAQKAENLVVGAPCGLMDQLSSYLGQKNKLLPLICQPHTVLEAIAIPAGLSFCAIDSGIRHAVSGASYGDVRAAAFMAYTIVALEAGASLPVLKTARETGNWKSLPYQGFLANINPSEFDSLFASKIPIAITGEEFLQQYGVSIDTVTGIDPSRQYQLRTCAKHPVMENFRIRNFMQLLQHFSRLKDKEMALQLMGEMMFQSHASYSAVGLGNEHTDEIVRMVRAAGPASGVYGARITGGGSGGTVCILCSGKTGKATARALFNEYRKKHGIKSFFFSGSANGARFLNEML